MKLEKGPQMHFDRIPMRGTVLSTALLWVSLLLFVTPALGSDGVAEINQTCALQTGCFPSDPPGFPVTITGAAGRSYRLTGDLQLPQNTNGIVISTNNITIDLAGFSISCTKTVFVPQPVIQPCSTAIVGGTGSGITTDNSSRTGIEVRAGSVGGMQSDGLSLGRLCAARNLRVHENGGNGISGGTGCIIGNNAISLNTSIGINVFNGCKVSGNTVHANGSLGIATGLGATVSGNVVWDNGATGIVARDSTVSGNTVGENGSIGIRAFGGSTVSNNLVSDNGAFGLILDSRGGYRANLIDNNQGTVGGGSDLGGNLCDGSTTCP